MSGGRLVYNPLAVGGDRHVETLDRGRSDRRAVGESGIEAAGKVGVVVDAGDMQRGPAAGES